MKGEISGFVVLKGDRNRKGKDIEEELVKRVREKIGAAASFKECVVVERLPKRGVGRF